MNTDITNLMHQATENLEPVSTDLLERSVQQGLRLRRRRTTLLSVTGASAVLATAGLVVGGTQLFGSPSGAAVAGTTSPSAKASAVTKPAAVTPKQTLATLKSLIEAPGRTLSQPVARGGGSEGFNAASFVVDDGKGASFVEVFLASGSVQDPCAEPGAKCTTLPDGSKLFTLTEQPEYPGDRNKDGVVSNYVVLVHKDGRFISLTNYNAPAEKGTQHTRETPLFTVAQLTAMVESKAWKFPPAGLDKSTKREPRTVEPNKVGKTTR
jgi:hypothetical protein